MNPVLSIQNITKYHGAYKALDDVSLDVHAGNIHGLLGPNGAGKTTMLRIINQIMEPDSGTILLNGEILRPEHIANVGYMPEERGLYKSMKVGEQAIYLARLKGMTRHDARTQLQVWFDRMGIADWWNKKIQELSKGMAQKVQFIVTVLHKPDLLIFDEPFSGFDPVNAELIKNEIQQLVSEGATVIFSTHRMESVEAMCDHVTLLNKGNVVLDGTLDTIRAQHRSNQYEIGLARELQLDALAMLGTVAPHASFTPDDVQSIVLQLSADRTPAQLRSTLAGATPDLTHFKELIPSMNEVFIQAVSSHE